MLLPIIVISLKTKPSGLVIVIAFSGFNWSKTIVLVLEPDPSAIIISPSSWSTTKKELLGSTDISITEPTGTAS